jgi:hypothetical protein
LDANAYPALPLKDIEFHDFDVEYAWNQSSPQFEE